MRRPSRAILTTPGRSLARPATWAELSACRGLADSTQRFNDRGWPCRDGGSSKTPHAVRGTAAAQTAGLGGQPKARPQWPDPGVLGARDVRR